MHELEVLQGGEMEESKQSGNVTGLLAQNRNSLRKGKQQKLKIREEIFDLKRHELRTE
jgi:hypothetical protein